MQVEEANVLVTGAAGALGRAFCMDMASRGARIMACDIRGDALKALQDETGGGGQQATGWKSTRPM